MSDELARRPLRVLVLSPSAPGALAMVRCAQSLGHVAEARGDVAAAEGLLRTGRWDALVIDLAGMGDCVLEALRALAVAAPAGRPCMLLGTAVEAEPLEAFGWAAAGLDRLVPPSCDAADWRLALDPSLPAGFDPLPLARLRELDADVSRESVRALLDDSPRELELIRAALADRDAAAARRAAHSLKGGASQLGAQRVAGLCAQLEAQLELDDHAAAGATSERLAAAWHTVAGWLVAEAER